MTASLLELLIAAKSWPIGFTKGPWRAFLVQGSPKIFLFLWTYLNEKIYSSWTKYQIHLNPRIEYEVLNWNPDFILRNWKIEIWMHPKLVSRHIRIWNFMIQELKSRQVRSWNEEISWFDLNYKISDPYASWFQFSNWRKKI